MSKLQNRVRLTAGRVDAFTCPAGKSQAFLWDTEAPALALRMKPIMEERARANSVASGENYGKGSQKSDEPIKPIRTDEAVSDLANVSRDTIWKIERTLLMVCWA